MSKSSRESPDKALQNWNYAKFSSNDYTTHSPLHQERGSQDDLHPKCPFQNTQTKFLNVTPNEKSRVYGFGDVSNYDGRGGIFQCRFKLNQQQPQNRLIWSWLSVYILLEQLFGCFWNHSHHECPKNYSCNSTRSFKNKFNIFFRNILRRFL